MNKLEEYLNKKIKFVFPEDELLIPIPEKHKNIQPNKPERKKSYNRNYKKNNRRK